MSQRANNRILSLVVAAAAVMTFPAAARAQDTAAQQTQGDTAGQDTTRWGYQTDTTGVQNPPGYRGMERDTTLFPPDTTQDTTERAAVEDRVTGTYEDTAWQDTTGARQNPPGYRGMERPVGEDTGAAGQQDTSAAGQQDADTGMTGGAMGDTAGGDTTQVGETTPRTPSEPTQRLPAARGDTAGQDAGAAGETGGDTTSTVRVGADTTGDTTRFGVNAEEDTADTAR